MRAVARYADGWNTFLIPEDDYRHKLDVLARHCADAERDPGDIRKAVVFAAMLGEDDAEAEDSLRRRAGACGSTPTSFGALPSSARRPAWPNN